MQVFFFLSIRHLIIQPWYISTERSVRTLCRGWTCGSSKENLTSNDLFAKLIKSYKKGESEISLKDGLSDLISSNFLPALSASGIFHLFNIGGFEYNPEESYQILKKCANEGFWACHEHLAFHPLTDNRSFHLHEAAEKGSVISMQKIAFNLIKEEKYEEANEYLYPLLEVASHTWFQDRRTGLEYAKDVKSILLNKKPNKAWNDLKNKAYDGNLPAALWVFNGFLAGKYDNITSKELSHLTRGYVENAVWKYDITDIFRYKEGINHREIVRYFSRVGNEAALALCSYSSFNM